MDQSDLQDDIKNLYGLGKKQSSNVVTNQNLRAGGLMNVYNIQINKNTSDSKFFPPPAADVVRKRIGKANKLSSHCYSDSEEIPPHLTVRQLLKPAHADPISSEREIIVPQSSPQKQYTV